MPAAPSTLGTGPRGRLRRSLWRLLVRRRDFAIISGASAVSQLGSMSVAAAGPLLALSLTGSPVVAGCVTAASVLPELLLQVPAGLLVDRFDRRKVMWWSQAVRVVFAVITCLSLAWCDSVAILIVMALIDASCSVVYEVAEIATVPNLVSLKSLNLAIGSNEAKLNASMVLGRPLGGALLTVNALAPWIVAACTSLFPIFGLLFTGLSGRTSLRSRLKAMPQRLQRRRTSPGDHPPGIPVADAGKRVMAVGDHGKKGPVPLRDVLKKLAHDSFSRAVLAVCVLANFLFQVIVLLQIYLAERQGMPSYLVGLMLSCSGIGGVAGAVVSPWILRRRTPSVTLVLPCVLVWIPLVWAAVLPQNPAVGLAMWGLCSVIGVYVNVALRTHQAKTFPNGQFGRIIGITRFLSVGAVAMGALIGGWIIRFIGVHGTAILVGGTFSVIPGVMLMVLYFRAPRDSFAGAGVQMRKVADGACRSAAGSVRRLKPRTAKNRSSGLLDAETPSSAPAKYSVPAGRG